MNGEAAAYLALSLGVLCLSIGCRPRACAAVALVGVWSAANLLYVWDSLSWLPLIDLPVALVSYMALIAKPEPWRFILTVSFACRLMLHIMADWLVLDYSLYSHMINAAYLTALAAIGWEGGKHAFSGGVRCVRRLGLLGRTPDARMARKMDRPR